jgi:hypothetical protein
MSQTQPGSFLPFRPYRQCYLVFDYSDAWYSKWLKGFTHVFYVLPIAIQTPHAIITEPYHYGAQHAVGTDEAVSALIKGKKVLIINYRVTRKNRLFRPLFQTCTTVVQYLAGFSLGALTAQGLYNRLTKSSKGWLESRGIMEVTEWVEEATTAKDTVSCPPSCGQLDSAVQAEVPQ